MHTINTVISRPAGRFSRPFGINLQTLIPAWFVRWTVRRRLSSGERYLFDLLHATPRHVSVMGDIIYNATQRPSMEAIRRLLPHLASQCNDCPRVMGDIIGDELALLLRAQRALYRIDQKTGEDGIAVSDMRHLKPGAKFRITQFDAHIYEVIENSPTLVLYLRSDVDDPVVRGYPKLEGPINVYVLPAE